MQLNLQRVYHTSGTNGILRLDSTILCYTIELPWNNNRPHHSCIPEGNYRLFKRYSARNRHHLWLQNVPGRSYILIHPANDAATQLQGCIAPVTALTGHGKGDASRAAMQHLTGYVFKALSEKEPVWLEIEEIK